MVTESTQPAEQFTEFLLGYYKNELGQFVQRRSEDDRSFVVDWMRLFQANDDLAEDLLTNPKQVKPAATSGLKEALKSLPVDIVPDQYGDLHCRFTNLHDSSLKGADDTRSRHIGQFHEMYGQVSKVSQITPQPYRAVFKCERCGTHSDPIPQDKSGELREPYECRGCERQGPFTLQPDESDWIDGQKVRIQQPPEETLGGQGAHLDVILRDDAVMPLSGGQFKPGNRVKVTGRYTVETNGKGPQPYLMGDVVQVEETDYEEIDITPDDKDAIEAVASGEEGDPFELVMDSLAPNHHGDSHIKLALSLQMFRGVRSQRPDGSWTRGDSHILLLGDPGVGKSSLLRRVADVAPRSAYASGKGASAAGMTAAAVPSDFGDEKWDVQAGVLVLATGGIACVDEIDKVQEDAVSSMHDALEAPQVVEVDKADIHTTLPAQTSLLAAGNPKYGRFNKQDSIMEQCDISPTLMSRFDLLFIVRDEPDEDRDRELAHTIIDSRQSAIDHTHGDEEDAEEPPLSETFLRKYVAHARQTVYPRIRDEEVADHMADLFIKLRESAYGIDNPVPVTPRKIEAFQRLAEASARVRLSDTVEKEDVNRISNLIIKSMNELGVNEEGQFDADVIETGTSKTQRDRIMSLKQLIKNMQSDWEEGVPIEKVLDKAERNGIERSKAEHEIEKLKARGDAYEPSTDCIHLV